MSALVEERTIEEKRALNAESVAALVNDFYNDVRADAVLGPVFQAAIGNRWAVHLQRMVDFWSTTVLGTRSFSGNVFAKHMALTGIQPEHFERWLHHWCTHTNRLFEPKIAEDLQFMAHRVARVLINGYVKQGSLSL